MADRNLPNSIDATLALLAKADYVADRSLATVLYLALRMGWPLFEMAASWRRICSQFLRILS